MAMITPDFTDAVDFTPLKPGTYKARITGAKAGQTSTGKARVQWELTIFGSDTPATNNRKVWHSTMLEGPGASMLKVFYKAATGQEAPNTFDTDTLLGKEIQITVVEGKDYKTGAPTDFPEVKAVARLAS